MFARNNAAPKDGRACPSMDVEMSVHRLSPAQTPIVPDCAVSVSGDRDSDSVERSVRLVVRLLPRGDKDSAEPCHVQTTRRSGGP
jgi:hypothetical protein